MSYDRASRLGLMLALAAGAMLAAPAVSEDDALGRRIDIMPDSMRDINPFLLAPRAPRGSRPSKYMPHQGKREMARRAKRLAQTA